MVDPTIASLWGMAASRSAVEVGYGVTRTQAGSYTRLLHPAVWTGMWCLQVGPAASTLLLVSPSAPFPCCSILQTGFMQRLVPSLSKPGNPVLYTHVRVCAGSPGYISSPCRT